MNTPSMNSEKWILRTTYYIHSRHTHRPIALLVFYIHTIVKELMKHGKCHCSKVLPQFHYCTSICRATTRPPRPSSTAECLCLIARLRGEQASAASWEPRPPFEATEMD